MQLGRDQMFPKRSFMRCDFDIRSAQVFESRARILVEVTIYRKIISKEDAYSMGVLLSP